MKKLSVLFLALVTLSFTSCDLLNMETSVIDDIVSADKTEVTSEDLPQAANDILNTNYFETFIEKVSLADGLGYEVELGNDQTLYFDLEGSLIEDEKNCKGKGHKGCKGKGTEIELSELPTLVTGYISETYPDAAIKRAKVDDNGDFLVAIEGPLFLVFDSEGNFVEEHEFAHRGKKGTEVALEDLSSLITDYITANYEGATLKMAFLYNDEYHVGITNSNDERVLLVFDNEGNFIEEKTCNGK